MGNTKKPNVSPLEVEIENKIRLAYLFSIAAKSKAITIEQAYLKILMLKNPKKETN